MFICEREAGIGYTERNGPMTSLFQKSVASMYNEM